MNTSRPTKAEQAEIEDAREKLLKWLSPGDTVWTILRSVSRSGMTRHIEPIIIDEDRAPFHIGGYVAKVLGDKWADDGGVVRGGCGMDMGLDLVYSLSRTLWRDGFDCIGEGCPSNDHVNRHHCDRFDDDGRRVAPMVVTCGGCGRSWCERCDPAPSALCHWCHGRGESWAELPETRKHHSDGGYALKQRWM